MKKQHGSRLPANPQSANVRQSRRARRMMRPSFVRGRCVMSSGQIVSVDPAAAIPGGEVSVECDGYDTSNLRECRAMIGGESARMVGAAPWRVLAIVPETLEEGGEVDAVL